MTEQKPLVLIADDEPNISLLLRRLFEQNQFVVESVADGLSALEKAEALFPDLILIDVQMPGMDGFEVVRRLRQNQATARIPTIFITAVARQPRDVVKGLDLGADDYVLKPFNPHELMARAHSKIRAHLLEEQLERRTQELAASVRIGREFNQQLQLDELLDLIVSMCAMELPAEQVLLYHFDSEVRGFDWRALQKVREPAAAAFLDEPNSFMAEVLNADRPVSLSDAAQAFLPPGCRAVMGTKIVHHDNVLGILLLGHSDVDAYDDGHVRLLESIAEQAALAIRNAELYAKAQHYALNLENMVAERTTALRAAQSQLIRSEKLAALGRLSAGIAHEVNNPLQAIRNCLELAIEDLDARRPVDKEMLVVAEQDVQRIRRIVSRLLDFARPGSSEREMVDMGSLVSEVLRLVEGQFTRANINVVKHITAAPPILGNDDQLKQVILNLLLNAREAMPDGGTLTVDVRKRNREILISFADTGIGIAEDDLELIFDPFFSTKPEGTGLGLAVSYGIVEGHGGRIEVESVINRGSRFVVMLPCE